MVSHAGARTEEDAVAAGGEPRRAEDRGEGVRDHDRVAEAREEGLRAKHLGEIDKISKNLQIFGGLVLGCIKTKFCKKICV